MNWDSIRYIFQIPLSWYQKIHKRVFNAYGTNFLTVREGYYGGTEIAVDSDGFAAEVNRAVNLSGYVKTVDGQTPDENGNVELSGYVKSIDGQTPDENGNIELSGYVKTIDGEEPDISGNIDLSDYYVTVDTDQTITGEKTFENVVNVSNGTAANDASIQVDNSGKLKIEQGTETIVETPKVTIANSTNTGHIDIDSSVPSLELYGHPNGLGGNIDFHTEGSTVDYTSRIIDSANQFAFLTFDRPIFLYSYYQNTSNATGIMIASANGNYQQLLTNEPPRLYSTGENNQIATRGYCRLNFSQTSHTHGNIANNGQITVDSGATPTNYYIAADSNGNLYRKATTGLVPDLSDYVTQDDLTDYVQYDDMTSYVGTELQDYALTSELTDFVMQNDLTGYVQTVNGISPTNGNVNVGTVKSVNGNTPDANGNVTISTGGGTVKSVDHVSPDQQGNVQINAIRTINGHNGDSVGNFAGVVTSINGNTPTDGAVTMTVVESVDGVSPDANGNVQLDAVKTVNSISPDANGNVEIDAVKSVDGHSPDTNGAVSFGLTASKWVKTDSSGHLTTTNDNVVTIASNQTGQTTNIGVVTGVTWNGTQLVVARKQLNFSNGVLTSTTNLTNTTIDTVVYTP